MVHPDRSLSNRRNDDAGLLWRNSLYPRHAHHQRGEGPAGRAGLHAEEDQMSIIEMIGFVALGAAVMYLVGRVIK